MTLINGDRIVTAQLYDDEHEEFTEKKMSIIDYVNAYTDEGVTTADDVLGKIRAEIQGLRNCSCSNSDGIIDDIEDILDKYKVDPEIEKLPPVKPQESKLIPVSERLPTREEYIANNGLFIVSDGNRTYAEYFDIYDSMKFGEPTIGGFKIDECVIAWMPMPEPYKAESGE